MTTCGYVTKWQAVAPFQTPEILVMLPWAPTAWESLKPSSRSLPFPVIENLPVWFTVSILPPCPKALSFPHFQREIYLCQPFAKLFKEFTEDQTVLESTYITHNPAQLIHHLAGSFTPSLSISHISLFLSLFAQTQLDIQSVSASTLSGPNKGFFPPLRWISPQKELSDQLLRQQ